MSASLQSSVVGRPSSVVDFVFRRLPHIFWWGSSLLACLLAACTTPSPTPPGTPALIRLLTTDLTEPLAYDLALAYAEVNTAVLVAPALETPDRLAAELNAGGADLALTISPDPSLFGTPIGYLPLSIVVHPDNAIASLTVVQAQDIFVGRVRDWSAVSAEQGEIVVAARQAGSPADDFFRAQLWGDPPPSDASVSASARLAPTWGAMRELLSENPQALGYLIEPELADFVRPVPLITAEGQPAEMQALLVAVSSDDPTGPARDFLAWVQTPAGQVIVAQRHAALEP